MTNPYSKVILYTEKTLEFYSKPNRLDLELEEFYANWKGRRQDSSCRANVIHFFENQEKFLIQREHHKATRQEININCLATLYVLNGVYSSEMAFFHADLHEVTELIKAAVLTSPEGNDP